MRKVLNAMLPLMFLAACGGGGSGGVSGGGGGGGGTGQTIAGPGPNVAALTVSLYQVTSVNIPYISVTVCQPGTSTCQTIDNIEVDTGSAGLRILSTASTAAFLQSLPQQLVANTTTPVIECAQFADGFSWGPVASADVTISGETASRIPIHVIGAPAPYDNDVPSSCSSIGPEEDTVALFGANGIIGVGATVQDCGSLCTTAVTGAYYECPPNGAGCTPVAEPIESQVSNPVASFTTDNNGVIVELPSVAANGATSATGALVFGIGTESNNALGSATIITLDTSSGVGAFDVTFNSTDYPGSILDSGSNALFFDDSALTTCAQGTTGAGFYCTAANLTATITGTNGTQLTASFSVGDAATMFNATANGAAFPQLAGSPGTMLGQLFDFGLPYFYGRNVFTAIEGMSAGGTQGPYYAY
ncbi:MAG TPA: DUF3443 family protein [Steroidobacteraceae bacterium]|jgi:hypothetical protein|nr:DUF3443 family protein [Steroidobacteraceae bacterium]